MFKLLYQDAALAVIHKPSGWLVHRSDMDRHETRIVVQAARNQLSCHVYPAHRLDKGTSGCLLLALSAEHASALGKQFEAHQVNKRYWAIVRGHMPSQGLIDHPLSRIIDDRSAAPASEELQTALTRFTTLAHGQLPVMIETYPSSRYSLVELEPVTGRQHQIRRHLKHLSHPIIGDSTYGRGRHNRYFATHYQAGRLLLICMALTFEHPLTGQRITVQTQVDDDFARVGSHLFGEGFFDQGV